MTAATKIKYYTTMGLYWAVIASCVSFLNVFLTGRGINPTEIGIITAIGNLLAAISQPVVSTICEHSNKNERDFLVLIAMSAMSFVIMALNKHSGIIMNIEIIVAISLVLVMQPLLNSLGYFYIKRKVEINYGVSRGIGSITFAITSFILGYLTKIKNDLSMVMAAVLLGGFILALLSQKPISGDNVATIFDRSKDKSIVKNKRFFGFLLGVGLLFTFYNVINVYLFQIAKEIGGDQKTVGTAFSLAAIFEFPVMFLFLKIKSKIKIDRLLIISSCFFLIKGILTYISKNPTELLFIQITQLFGFALFTPASVDFVAKIMPQNRQIIGQGYLASAITFGGVLGSVLGGFMIDLTGISNTVLISNIVAVISVLLIAISTIGCDE